MESLSDQVTKVDVGYEIPTWNNWTPLAKFYHPLQAGSIDGTDTLPHDKAVSRALEVKYKPNKRVSGDPDKTLFVGKLSKDTRENTVYKVFAKCGELVRCRLIRDVVTGFSKGYAFVEYRSERDANVAWRELHNYKVDGSTVLVEYEAARTLKGWIPRRLGGGFGGKKESGQLRFGGRDRPFRRPIPTDQDGKQHKYLRGSRDHEGARSARENYRDSYRERRWESSRAERERDGYREKRDRDSSRSSFHYRDRDDDSDVARDWQRYRERDSDRTRDSERSRDIERSRDSERSRDRGGERYKDRGRHGDSEGYRNKDRYSHRDKDRESYETSLKKNDAYCGTDQEEGEIG